jgi:hypothetical protein
MYQTLTTIRTKMESPPPLVSYVCRSHDCGARPLVAPILAHATILAICVQRSDTMKPLLPMLSRYLSSLWTH